jgi:hypothetical protein
VKVVCFMKTLSSWTPTEKFFIKSHIVGSIATLVCAVSVTLIGLIPSLFPDIHRLLVDERVGTVIPYLLLIALGNSLFSIWFFLFRKDGK